MRQFPVWPFDIPDHSYHDKSRATPRHRLQPGGEYVQKALKSAVRIQAQGTSHPLNSGSAFVERSIRNVKVFRCDPWRLAELRIKIMRYIRAYNKMATPITWTYANPKKRISQ